MDIFKHCHLILTICKSICTEIPLFSVDFEVTALLRAGLTETWPKNSQDKGRESFPSSALRQWFNIRNSG